MKHAYFLVLNHIPNGRNSIRFLSPAFPVIDNSVPLSLLVRNGFVAKIPFLICLLRSLAHDLSQCRVRALVTSRTPRITLRIPLCHRLVGFQGHALSVLRVLPILAVGTAATAAGGDPDLRQRVQVPVQAVQATQRERAVLVHGRIQIHNLVDALVAGLHHVGVYLEQTLLLAEVGLGEEGSPFRLGGGLETDRLRLGPCL
mmetsp:Transcript_137/g.358  ORF Transcript_137/g.358 Transcript_137/m.358 type:complete len:201 (-) Transcript_137:2233-2835(-)